MGAPAETLHPLAGFTDDSPTGEVAKKTPSSALVTALPTRDHATLMFVEGPMTGAVVTLAPEGAIVLGRGAGADVRVPEDTVSRQHARIRWDGMGYVIEDLGSSGTWVNGWKVESWRPLPAGARVQLGAKVRVRFDLHDAEEQRVIADLYEAAMRDALTGAYTRRYLHERLHAELSYAARHKTPVALLMLDLDHFKLVNDRHGHRAGDEVLRVVVAELRSTLRPEDVLVRYGGEELCVLVRGLTASDAQVLAERLRGDVAKLRVPIDRDHVSVTVSIGVAVTDPEAEPPSGSALVERADRALYRAKRAGRDRSCIDVPTRGREAPSR